MRHEKYGELLRVKIVSCSNYKYWYQYYIGEMFYVYRLEGEYFERTHSLAIEAGWDFSVARSPEEMIRNGNIFPFTGSLLRAEDVVIIEGDYDSVRIPYKENYETVKA